MLKDLEIWQRLAQTWDSASKAHLLSLCFLFGPTTFLLSKAGITRRGGSNPGIPPGGTEVGRGDEEEARHGEAHCIPWGQGWEAQPPSVHTSASPDVDECLEQSDDCHYNQLCENTPGGHRCSCPRGYRIQGPGLPCLGMGTLAPFLEPGSVPPGS